MNIPIQSEEEFDKKTNFDREYEKIEKATQWRVIFYIKNFQVRIYIYINII